VVEVGAKVQNTARTLQLNLAAFSTRYRDVQLTYFESFGAPVTANGGDSRIKGFDLELKALPLNNLNVGVSAGYLDAYYTSLAPGLNAGATTPEQFITLESRLPNTPRWQVGIDLDYTIQLPASRRLLLAVSGRHSSLVYNDAQNSPFLRQGAYTIADASATFSAADDAWSMRLYVDNLSAKRYIVSGDSNFGIGFHEAEFNRPREYGAGLTYRF
jgi:iron complex outermembrane receptor protein